MEMPHFDDSLQTNSRPYSDVGHRRNFDVDPTLLCTVGAMSLSLFNAHDEHTGDRTISMPAYLLGAQKTHTTKSSYWDSTCIENSFCTYKLANNTLLSHAKIVNLPTFEISRCWIFFIFVRRNSHKVVVFILTSENERVSIVHAWNNMQHVMSETTVYL